MNWNTVEGGEGKKTGRPLNSVFAEGGNNPDKKGLSLEMTYG